VSKTHAEAPTARRDLRAPLPPGRTWVEVTVVDRRALKSAALPIDLWMDLFNILPRALS
jgi:hypothetical protein